VASLRVVQPSAGVSTPVLTPDCHWRKQIGFPTDPSRLGTQVVLGAVNVATGLLVATLHRWRGLWAWVLGAGALGGLAVVCTASLEMRKAAQYRRMRELKL
jgi:hypothetical protein